MKNITLLYAQVITVLGTLFGVCQAQASEVDVAMELHAHLTQNVAAVSFELNHQAQTQILALSNVELDSTETFEIARESEELSSQTLSE